MGLVSLYRVMRSASSLSVAWLALAFGGAVPATAAAPAAGNCRVPTNAIVWSRASHSVIFSTSRWAYGCHRGGRRVRIAEVRPDDMDYVVVERAAVRARYAAVVTRDVSHYGCVRLVAWSVDLNSGTPQVRAALIGSTDCQETVDAVRIDRLVVGSRGSIAVARWNRDREQVVRASSGRDPRVLDPGPGVIASSLRLRGDDLHWLSPGGERTARLR
jgi:hypothetical protein